MTQSPLIDGALAPAINPRAALRLLEIALTTKAFLIRPEDTLVDYRMKREAQRLLYVSAMGWSPI